MTFTLDDKRDKIRSQLKHEITHPGIFYDISKARRDKLDRGLSIHDKVSMEFEVKHSEMEYASTLGQTSTTSSGEFCCIHPTCPEKQGPPFTTRTCRTCGASCRTCRVVNE
jgi:hypothetical protein